MKVLIAVTHLLGTGHLARALTLARAFHAAGHHVQVLSGGLPVPHLATGNVIQVPPLASDGTNFTRLLTDTGSEADAAYLAHRRDVALECLHREAPDVLICELYPFGRRVLADEFNALLEAAQTLPERPLILCSVRDILAPPSRPEKVARTEAVLQAYFDAVLVHSDPDVIRLEASWPVSPVLEPMLRYTGFVAPPPAADHPDRAGAGEVLVTAGGGPVGEKLYATAILAAARAPGRTWRLLVGGAERCAALASVAPANAIVEPARSDFRSMLRHAAASVSMCGYNTALDLLQAGTPAVLVPFDDGGEVEQGLRAASLARLPGFDVLQTARLTPDSLLNAVNAATSGGRRPATTFNFDGASETVRIARTMQEERA